MSDHYRYVERATDYPGEEDGRVPPEHCPCIKLEAPVKPCGEFCWHFGGSMQCKHCDQPEDRVARIKKRWEAGFGPVATTPIEMLEFLRDRFRMGVGQAVAESYAEDIDMMLAGIAPTSGNDEVEQIASMCEAAMHDERLSDGPLYGKAAALLRKQAAENVRLEARHEDDVAIMSKQAAQIESLRAECGLRQIQGYNEGRAIAAAQIAELRKPLTFEDWQKKWVLIKD